ncbi:MAG: type II toxin-antitoxin system HicB family antitoxin, partial [Anaerolineae bacterium]
MNVYDVCLETSAEGLCMAHVPNLPGCFARGRGREEVLARLPRTIAEYHDWLADHGESAGVCSNGFSRVFPGRGPKAAEAATTNGGEEIEIRVVEETGAVGPFHAGDAAALFAADHEPVGPGEMEDYFRWMGYARADLLALVRHLPPDLLDWQPFPEWFS